MSDNDFDSDASLDASQIDDRRDVDSSGGGFGGGGGYGGYTGGGGGGFSIPGGGMTVGGGIVGLIIVVIGALLGTGTIDVGGLTGGGSGSSGDNRALAEKCSVNNPDRFKELDCRNGFYVNDIQQFWKSELPKSFGVPYRVTKAVFFSRATNTGCGQADSAVGPFYCPADELVYIDLSFYSELASRFGAPGQFAQAYVLAHEFGHHVQNLTGTERKIRQLQQQYPSRKNKYSIALELQADCYAGVWAKNAGGGPVATVDQRDIQEALQAAAAVGDDRIQQSAGGGVNEETWTHGSAQSRQQWFFTGYNSGDPRQCETLR
ncbi:KPN_02809 family neutral zinc metallopeptidase [Fodinicola acaciae]|uniref:KPN_02809 family neutral zinc metallopeptidase n=1 Tax=Fodinicola acaciae TaxID=2681555 RepID=UPI0013CF70F7|nr:neutral zinc metallopeptidase [Fodinicola acaciae]